jgi:hypothetical protein
VGPKNQRPELWSLYNGKIHGEHLRIFPLSNWTELDIWHDIGREGIEIPSIYFSHQRKVTPKRTFIIADTPGHVQYTRNMVTGASTADLGLALVATHPPRGQRKSRHSSGPAALSGEGDPIGCFIAAILAPSRTAGGQVFERDDPRSTFIIRTLRRLPRDRFALIKPCERLDLTGACRPGVVVVRAEATGDMDIDS